MAIPALGGVWKGPLKSMARNLPQCLEGGFSAIPCSGTPERWHLTGMVEKRVGPAWRPAPQKVASLLAKSPVLQQQGSEAHPTVLRPGQDSWQVANV